jgi:hypothetical protein
MSPLRDFVKKLRKASGEGEKLQAAVSATRDLGYEYVAIYRLESFFDAPLQITLQAQDGTPLFKSVPSGIVNYVAKSGQSRIATPPNGDGNSRAGKLGAVACTSIGMTNRYGVLVACRTTPHTITQQQVTLLEMVSAQLAAALSKE